MIKTSVLFSLFVSMPLLAAQFELSGQFRLRHIDYDVYKGAIDSVDTSGLRARAQLEVLVDERRHFRLTPQATKVLGELQTIEDTDGNGAIQRTSGDQYGSELEFFEAYGGTSFGSLDLTLGRQELVYGEGLILGNRNWTLNGQTFDAIKASIMLGEGELDGIYAKIQNSRPEKFSDDISLSGLYYRVFSESVSKLDVYIFMNNMPGNEGSRDSLTSGFRFKNKLGKWTFTTENIYQDFYERGEWAYSLNFKARLDRQWGHIFGHYALASKDYDQLYANRHSYNGLIDIVGRRNLQTISTGAQWNLSPKFNFKAEFLNFQKSSPDDYAYNLSTDGALDGDIDQEDIGSELDLLFNYGEVKDERIQFGYMLFKHGKYFEKQDISKFAYVEYLSLF